VKLKPAEIIDAKYFTTPFSQLLEKYPFLNSLLISVDPPKFDLGDPYVLSFLNKYLYKEVVGLEISIPKNNLIPSLGIRYAYCEYMNSLLKSNYPLIEIGTGSSAVIAMILAKVYNKKVLATEIEKKSLQSARKNIEKNHLSNSIKMIHSKGEIIHNLIPKGRYSGLLCFPPIYGDDLTILAKKRGWKGTQAELMGGGKKGLDFSLKLLEEALEHKDVKIDIISLMILNKNQLKLIQTKLLKGKENHFIQINAGTRKRYVLIVENI
jgi:23S rRNA A1618 N6-methylase RlmF